MKDSASQNTSEAEGTQDQVSQAQEAPTSPNQVRTLAHPLDTVSSATREMFEVRSTKSSAGQESNGTGLAFKIIAVVAIVLLVVAIAASQIGAL